MFIKVLDENNQNKYFMEAAYIEWQTPICIAVYPNRTKTKHVGSVAESETEVATKPSLYLHVKTGDTVYIMNNDGKTVDKKRIQ
jgi:hypothetical protein